MKKILTNTITLFTETTALIVSIMWFINSKGYEPILAIIFSSSSLITSLVLKSKEEPNLEIKIIPNGKGAKPTQPSLKTPKNKDGVPVMQAGNMIGKREIYWKYLIKVVNNSSITAFNPELYVSDEFSGIYFIGDLDVNSPIKGAESIDLEFTYTKWTDGTPSERKAEHQPKFPPELLNGFKLIIKYTSESGNPVYKKFEFLNNDTVNEKIKKIPKNFTKAKIYKRMFKP